MIQLYLNVMQIGNLYLFLVYIYGYYKLVKEDNIKVRYDKEDIYYLINLNCRYKCEEVFNNNDQFCGQVFCDGLVFAIYIYKNYKFFKIMFISIQ